MIHIAEVVETKGLYKTKQKSPEGLNLFDGTILVRVGGSEGITGQVRNEWAAPATFNRRIPLIGEQVLVFQAPSTEVSSQNEKTVKFFYLAVYNTINDVTLHQLPNKWLRSATVKGSKNTAPGLNDRGEVGYTIPKSPGRSKMLQPFEGDDLWEGRFGQSIRFTRTSTLANPPGPAIYEQQSLSSWIGTPGPMIIMKVKSPDNGQGYDLEDLGEDDSSIYMTTTQKLLKFKPGFGKNLNVKTIPMWSSGGQIVVSSDRLVLNAKTDKAFLIAKDETIVTSNKVLFQSNKYRVYLDDLMDWLKDLSGELNKLTSAQAMFTTAMGPTGISTNMAQVLKIVNVDFNVKFKSPV